MGHIIQSTLNNLQCAHALRRYDCFMHELLLHVTSLQIGYYECSVVPAKVHFYWIQFYSRQEFERYLKKKIWAASWTSCGAGWWWCPSSRWETPCRVSEITAFCQRNFTQAHQNSVSNTFLFVLRIYHPFLPYCAPKRYIIVQKSPRTQCCNITINYYRLDTVTLEESDIAAVYYFTNIL